MISSIVSVARNPPGHFYSESEIERNQFVKKKIWKQLNIFSQTNVKRLV